MNKHLVRQSISTSNRKLSTLIENRTAYSFEHCELNLYETHKATTNVDLTFDNFVLTSMLTGKKVMNLKEKVSFDYLPGESVILPPGETMNIDFPEAKDDNPTKCLALTISNDVIRQTINRLNELNPKASSWGSWNIDTNSLFHLNNNKELADTIGRIVCISQNERGKVKDIMIELTVSEMLVRLMQTQARQLFETSYELMSSNNALAAVIEFIKNNLTNKINFDKLADRACMSRSSFFKKFKETMGETPSQFILRERIELAKQKLKFSNNNVTEVCFISGFENLSHFIKAFKRETGVTPKFYQESFGGSALYQ